MSIEAINKVTDSEKQAENIVNNAQLEAKRIIANAESEGKSKLVETEKEVEAKRLELLAKAQQTAETERQEILKKNDNERNLKFEQIQTKLPEAVAFIVNKVVGS